jgi:hypothetical protein
MRSIGKATLAACVSLTAVIVSGPSRADVTVYVGYADNLRASGFFPSPWLGASDVTSVSSAAQSFDTGAIRIDNTGATSVTISNLSVFFPSNSSTFNLPGWATAVTLAPGQNAIYTQTVSYNLDTSDFGAFGGLPPTNLDPSPTNLIGGCSSPVSLFTSAQKATCNGTVPVITFDLNGTPHSFDDTGHILDTGEWDFVNNNNGALPFRQDGNESINWNIVGTEASRGGTGAPEPATLALLSLGRAGLGFARRRR